MALSAYGAAYLPYANNVPLMSASLSARLTTRWSLSLRTQAATDQSVSGFSIGGIYQFRAHDSISTTPSTGYARASTTVTPHWQPSVGFAIGRWGFAQTLKLAAPNLSDKLRDVPVKASLYGAQVSAGLARTFGQRWAIEATYYFSYGVTTGLTLVGQAATIGPSYWF